jgi:hypothetical protein
MRIRTDPGTFAAVILFVMVAAIAGLLLVLGSFFSVREQTIHPGSSACSTCAAGSLARTLDRLGGVYGDEPRGRAPWSTATPVGSAREERH